MLGHPWEVGLSRDPPNIGYETNSETEFLLQVDGGLKTGRDVVIGATLAGGGQVGLLHCTSRVSWL